MSDRLLTALLRTLQGTLWGLSDNTLQKRFGTHVHVLISQLIVDRHAEHDLGGRLRLTASGRSMAHDLLKRKAAAA